MPHSAKPVGDGAMMGLWIARAAPLLGQTAFPPRLRIEDAVDAPGHAEPWKWALHSLRPRADYCQSLSFHDYVCESRLTEIEHNRYLDYPHRESKRQMRCCCAHLSNA